ncbi:MAG: type VI secretion system tube protein Hcp [bacterium]
MLIFGGVSTQAAMDMFLKMDDLHGESLDAVHTNEIDVLAWSWGMSNSGTMHTGGGGGGGKVSVQDLSLTKYVDKSSSVLFNYVCSGKQFAEVKLTIRTGGGPAPVEFLIITMTDVIVTSLSTGGSGGEDRLTENITLNFSAFKVSYQPRKPDGTPDGGRLELGWDIAANVKM